MQFKIMAINATKFLTLAILTKNILMHNNKCIQKHLVPLQKSNCKSKLKI